MAEDYIKFASNIKEYINAELQFIPPESSRYYNNIKSDKRFGRYPIGKLNDIEIFFMHYSSEEEARSKWERRCEKINWDKLLIKFNDQNGCTKELIEKFTNLPYKHKICFVSDNYSSLKNVICLKGVKRQEYVLASQEPIGNSISFNVNELINGL